jgi:hypothetical protein
MCSIYLNLLSCVFNELMGKDFKFGGATVALRGIATVDKGLHEMVG